MTVVNPKSISGITSITTASGSDNLLTIHTSDANNTERLRIDSTGTTKIVTGIVTTLTATGSAKVGSGITLSPDGDIFATGISTFSEGFAGDVLIDDKIVHRGDINTAIRFPENDHISFETVGSEAIRIDDAGKLLKGLTDRRLFASGTTSSVQIEGLSASGSDASSLSIVNNQDGVGSPSIRLGKTRGTSVGSNTSVADNDQLGQILFYGADGTDIYNATAMIGAKVNGTVGTDTIPTDLVFETSAATTANRSERLRIGSAGQIGIAGENYGTDNQALTSQGSSSAVEWRGINKPSFAAYVSGTTALSTGVEATIVFNVEDHDSDNAYNTSTGEFTVPSGKGGVYHISANFGIDDPGEVGDILRLRVFKNGSLIQGFRGQLQQAKINIIMTTSVNGTVTLAAGDVIKCMGYTDSNVGDANIEVDCTYFSMFRLSI